MYYNIHARNTLLEVLGPLERPHVRSAKSLLKTCWHNTSSLCRQCLRWQQNTSTLHGFTFAFHSLNRAGEQLAPSPAGESNSWKAERWCSILFAVKKICRDARTGLLVPFSLGMSTYMHESCFFFSPEDRNVAFGWWKGEVKFATHIQARCLCIHKNSFLHMHLKPKKKPVQ
jgi:hypothetical protein